MTEKRSLAINEMKEDGETKVDKKSKEFQNALMLGFAYQYHRRLFNAIDQRGFRV